MSYDIVQPPFSGGAMNEVVVPISTGELVIFTIESYPDTISDSVATAYVGTNSLQERITGDWVFTITVD